LLSASVQEVDLVGPGLVVVVVSSRHVSRSNGGRADSELMNIRCRGILE